MKARIQHLVGVSPRALLLCPVLTVAFAATAPQTVLAQAAVVQAPVAAGAHIVVAATPAEALAAAPGADAFLGLTTWHRWRELLSLALSVPPWEPLHELSAAELRATNLVTMDAVADAAAGAATASVKPIQDRFTSEAVNPVAESRKGPRLTLPTKTAEAGAPTGGAAGPERK